MTIRRRKNRSKKTVTLDEVHNWIALGTFEDVSIGPHQAGHEIYGYITDDDALAAEDFRKERLLDQAEAELLDALCEGDIEAQGRFSNQHSSGSRATVWKEQEYEMHAAERTHIPPHFWSSEGMDLGRSAAKSPEGEYIDIVFDREEVVSLWSDEETNANGDIEQPDEGTERKRGQKRGPKHRYPVEDFFALCVLEADTNELPDSQAKMVDRMERLLAIIWGEDRVPGETWLKKNISQIYKHRDEYELGRRQVESSTTGAPSKTGS